MRLLLAALVVGGLTSAIHAHSHEAPAHPRQDIVATAHDAGSFKTLLKALEAAELTDALRGDGPFTVFAPTDEAFAALPAETVNALFSEAGKAQLASILQYHVVPEELDAAQVVSRPSLASLNGQRLGVQIGDGGVSVANARVLKTDIECSNGIIHVIDAVLLPSGDDLVATAKKAGTFETLLAACQAAGLVGVLSGEGPLTVLAPTDEAFAALSPQTLRALLDENNRDALTALLTYHVFPGRVYAAHAVKEQAIDPLNGPGHAFRIDGGRLTVSGATVVANDVEASNGVVQVIDSVLLPPDLNLGNGRLVVGFFSERPSEALASQLGIDRATSLVVNRVTEGRNAEKFGLRPFDVITAIDGEPVTDADLVEPKRAAGFGGVLRFTVIRAGETLELDIPVGVELH